MKKIFKTFIISIIMLLLMQINYSYAVDSSIEIEGSIETAELINTNDVISEMDTSDSADRLTERAGKIVAIIRNIGIVVSVIALMIIGIKIMVSSAEEKSIYKQALPGYILGVLMVAAITMIPSLIYTVVSGW